MPDSKPKRRFRGLRRLLIAAALALISLALGALLAFEHLDWIAKFAIHRLFPGVTAQMGSLRAVSATRIEVRKLTLKSSKTKAPLLALAGGTVIFGFGDIWRARLEEVRLDAPNLVISPDLNEALGVQPGKSGSRSIGSPRSWGIGRLIVNAGRLRIVRPGTLAPSATLRFSADLKNFGVGGEAAQVEHAVRLEKIAATDTAGVSFLRIAEIDLRFTTGELFTGNHLRAAHVGSGTVSITPGLIDFLTPHPAARSAPHNPPQSGWSVGLLDIDGVGVTVPDAPGVLGRVDFRISVALRDLGSADAATTNAEQRVVLSDLRFATDHEPAISLLSASRAEVRFSTAGLAARRVDNLILENPAIDFSPEADGGSGRLPSAPSFAANAPTWLIAHASCNYGTLRLRGLKDGALDVAAKFAFDAHDLGTPGDAANKSHELTFWDAKTSAAGTSPFLTLDVGSVSFTPAGLLAHKRIDAVKIDGGRLTVGDALQKLLAVDSRSAPPLGSPPAPDEDDWSIGGLAISGVQTRLEDRRPGLTDLRFTLNTTLRNVQAGGVSSELLEEVQTVEFANIDLNSPINRTARIVSLRSVFVRFTLRDLARRHLRDVVILRPSIFLSPDLFVYMERATASDSSDSAKSAASPGGPNWSLDHLDVKFGRLVVGSGGSKDVGLPLEFETTADNLALDNLATLQLQAVLRVPKQSYDFPDYQIAVTDVVGDLRFSYPPAKGEKNLVQKLAIAGVRWRQYRAKQAWVAATFDARGINGQFGGSSYGGYLNGGFSFFFRGDSPWIGWLSGTHVDTAAFTEVVSPENFHMTGPLNFELQFDAFRKDIQRVRGVFQLTEPGRLKIGKLDDLLANIPPAWSAIKQSSTRIALETLRDFDYTAATGDFWFVQSQGILNLDLNGPLGSRRFEVSLHDGEETQNKWQQGTLGRK
ncbi:MAG: hypothetical protein PHC88_00585 [Terrimicrobiaceae bacterium]|nr:hypothetical protein [Terrimicrobiaceae bacterium]